MKKKILGIALALALILTLVATAAPVLANPPTLDTVIDNLKEVVYGEYTSSPPFKCGEMSAMAFRFFKKAGYEPVVVIGTSPLTDVRHAWVESPQFDEGTYYESVFQRMRSSIYVENYTENKVYYYSESELGYRVNRWLTWYDWRWTRGDMDDDGDVDIFDFVLFADAYGTEVTEAAYAMLGDMDLDGDIDIFDFVLFADVYEQSTGQACPNIE